MEEIINDKISYTLKKSSRARQMRISVSCDGKVVVTMPWFVPAFLVNNFISGKADWIKKSLAKFSALPNWQKKKYTRKDYVNNKETVRKLVLSRLAYFCEIYSNLGAPLPSWKRVAIRDQKSRWGSCSRKGNLNFNYKLLFLPPELQDYIIVHELCHLRELNHSKRFWALVAAALPEYNDLRKKLKNGID